MIQGEMNKRAMQWCHETHDTMNKLIFHVFDVPNHSNACVSLVRIKMMMLINVEQQQGESTTETEKTSSKAADVKCLIHVVASEEKNLESLGK